jgi:transposase-like protein
MLTMGWLGVQKVLVQRWRCQGCGHELVSPERTRQAEARQAWWRQVKRLICLQPYFTNPYQEFRPTSSAGLFPHQDLIAHSHKAITTK